MEITGSPEVRESIRTHDTSAREQSVRSHDVPSAYLEVPAETPTVRRATWRALYRRLGNAVTHGAVLEPDFEHALIRHRLMDAIGCV